MAAAGFDNSINVLAKHVKLKLPVNQWLLCALAAYLDLLAVAIVPGWHRKPTSAQAPTLEKGALPRTAEPMFRHKPRAQGAAEQMGNGTVAGMGQGRSVARCPAKMSCRARRAGPAGAAGAVRGGLRQRRRERAGRAVAGGCCAGDAPAVDLVHRPPGRGALLRRVARVGRARTVPVGSR